MIMVMSNRINRTMKFLPNNFGESYSQVCQKQKLNANMRQEFTLTSLSSFLKENTVLRFYSDEETLANDFYIVSISSTIYTQILNRD